MTDPGPSVEEADTTRGGSLSRFAKDKPQEGEVISAGKGKISEEGKVRPLDVKEATAFCSASIPAPRSRSMEKTSSSCAKKKYSACFRRSQEGNRRSRR